MKKYINNFFPQKSLIECAEEKPIDGNKDAFSRITRKINRTIKLEDDDLDANEESSLIPQE